MIFIDICRKIVAKNSLLYEVIDQKLAIIVWKIVFKNITKKYFNYGLQFSRKKFKAWTIESMDVFDGKEADKA